MARDPRVVVSLVPGRNAGRSCLRSADRAPEVHPSAVAEAPGYSLESQFAIKRGPNRVAQSCRLLYRRIGFGGPAASRTRSEGPDGRRGATPRYGPATAGKICATSLADRMREICLRVPAEVTRLRSISDFRFPNLDCACCILLSSAFTQGPLPTLHLSPPQPENLAL